MLVSKANLTAHVATTDHQRPTLSGIAFRPEGTVSSDGVRLLIVPYPEEHDRDDDYPPVQGVAPWQPNGIDLIIPAPDCEAAAKSLPKRSTLPIVKLAHLTATVDPKNPGHYSHANIITTDLDQSSNRHVPAIVGTFPNYQQVIPQPDTEPKVRIAFRLRILESTLSELRNAGADTVAISIYNAESPIRIDAWGDDYAIHRGPVAVVMPLHLRPR